jgi:pyruvate formate lyase activating enzyme
MSFEGILYDKNPDSSTRCRLCAHYCTIKTGKRGICRVRENRDGTLYSLVYGKLVARNVDPIEKKPLYHFEPGTLSYSIATAGCNMSCSHCQNYQISLEAALKDPIPGYDSTPGEVVSNALTTGCSSISYTYTEPTIFMEFARDCAVQASGGGLSNVFVTNGYMSEESAALASGFLDAANVDLKAATEEHYRKICGAGLQPVLDTIRTLHEAGVWIEVTTLVIPGYNDDDSSLQFIASFISSVDPVIPWHLSRFFPTYRLRDAPPTPIETLERAGRMGEESGLKHVYLGNVPGVSDETRCSSCSSVLIRRAGFGVKELNLTGDGKCKGCGAAFDGVVRKSKDQSPKPKGQRPKG